MASKRRQLAKLNLHLTGPTPPIGVRWSGDGPVVYVEMTREPVAKTVEVDDDLLADYDARGMLVGFEIIGVTSPRNVKVPLELNGAGAVGKWQLEEACA